MPQLSIISGAYNISGCYSFRKSIESVLDQTFSDFEFIICEDGSHDNSWELLNEYAQKDSRIKLLRNEKNLGLAASLNRCIEVSVGQFIARHDCDDYNAPERFAKQISFLNSHPDVSLVGTAVILFDENGEWGKMNFPKSVSNRDFLFRSPFQHGSVMFRRDALLEAGCYRVAKETRRAEDYDLFMTMQTFCKAANLPEYLYYFCDDKKTRKRRKYRYRIDDVKVRWRGFKKLNLLPQGILHVIKPLIVGLIPSSMLERLKNRFYKRKSLNNDDKSSIDATTSLTTK